MNKIAPSLCCADLMNMEKQICEMEQLAIDWYHVDIMDGTFVPNFAFSADFIRSLRKVTQKPIYVHLMTVNPEKHIELIRNAGADYFVFHIEATNTPFRLAKEARNNGMKAGVTLNPYTPVEQLTDLLEYIDTVTLMSIEPGFAGQKFMDFTYSKISALRNMIDKKGLNVTIEIDGGINEETGRKSLEAGADVLVGGYFAIFKQNAGITENYNSFMKSIL